MRRHALQTRGPVKLRVTGVEGLRGPARLPGLRPFIPGRILAVLSLVIVVQGENKIGAGSLCFFTDSGIIGSKEFVSTHYQRFKHLFHSQNEKKHKPIKGLDGMYSLKRLFEIV